MSMNRGVYLEVDPPGESWFGTEIVTGIGYDWNESPNTVAVTVFVENLGCATVLLQWGENEIMTWIGDPSRLEGSTHDILSNHHVPPDLKFKEMYHLPYFSHVRAVASHFPLGHAALMKMLLAKYKVGNNQVKQDMLLMSSKKGSFSSVMVYEGSSLLVCQEVHGLAHSMAGHWMNEIHQKLEAEPKQHKTTVQRRGAEEHRGKDKRVKKTRDE
ncbi:hypothetical protein BU17DRAFT_64718 [Hysterangium stoloniferum]|nr:hypothetical protein BU17DRAFT_64718 [Hysterangium stoloniferum]